MGRFKLTEIQKLGVEAALATRAMAKARISDAYEQYIAPLEQNHRLSTARFNEIVVACSKDAGKEIPERAPFQVELDDDGRLTGFVKWETPPPAALAQAQPEPAATKKRAEKTKAKKKAKAKKKKSARNR